MLSFLKDLIESAIVDGCSRTGTIFRIVVPVTATGIGAIAVVPSLIFFLAAQKYIVKGMTAGAVKQ